MPSIWSKIATYLLQRGTYRQIGMMHEYHFFKAEACLEEENYPQAVINWGKAIDFGDKENQTGELSLEAQSQIAEYSTLAIKFSNDENRNDVKACIRIHAYSILPETARNKFKETIFSSAEISRKQHDIISKQTNGTW